MSLSDYEKPKYPSSKMNSQCIGPCYYPGTWIVHPLTLEYIYEKNYPFCPTKEWEYVDENGKRETKTYAECYHPTETKDLSGKEYEMNMLVPNISFNDSHFLKIFYNIHTFEDAINWITNNKFMPILTRQRIINCSWSAYGDNLFSIDNRLVNFYIELAKKLWIEKIYKKINKYVHINDNKVFLGIPDDNNLTPKNEIIIRTNFIIDRFINVDEIYKFLTKFLKNYKENREIDIANEFYRYIENKIIATLG